ncbi:hypothetical protein [Streptococcus catagoni]|uniref:hypothetical protein n=1 Tax=Streptococcus catagoni TaxID=2654874 RepID=UPI00140D1AE1|nr:hypothetical protein [Streptococcus catagoni]
MKDNPEHIYRLHGINYDGTLANYYVEQLENTSFLDDLKNIIKEAKDKRKEMVYVHDHKAEAKKFLKNTKTNIEALQDV